MKRWLVIIGLWVAKLGGYSRAMVPDYVTATARKRVKEQNRRWQDRDGEAKRAAVYRSLVNEYPAVPKRILSLAIEEAVCLEC